MKLNQLKAVPKFALISTLDDAKEIESSRNYLFRASNKLQFPARKYK